MTPSRAGVRSIKTIAPGAAVVGAGALLTRTAVELYAVRRDLARGMDDDSFAVDGTYGSQRSGTPIVIGMLGDSLGSGAGASAPEKTLAVLIALEIAHREQRVIRLINVARSGSGSRHLPYQTHELTLRLGGEPCDIAYVSIGAIDVSNRVPWGVARADIRTCAHDLTRTGAKVVFGMPERAILPTNFAGKPLVGLACDVLMSYRARKQRGLIDGMRARGYGVYVADTSPLRRAFRGNPHYTAGDGLHPSDAGQAAVADVLVPQLITALHAQGPTHPGSPHARNRHTQDLASRETPAEAPAEPSPAN